LLDFGLQKVGFFSMKLDLLFGRVLIVYKFDAGFSRFFDKKLYATDLLGILEA